MRKIDVRVNQQSTGQLFNENHHYVFNYDHIDRLAISLTMPARIQSYTLERLHPIFEMHLPEGYLLSVIKRHFSKLHPTDDFGLLQLLAPSVHGRIHYSNTQETQAPIYLESLIDNTQPQLFDTLVKRFALRSALSGVQPKVLAPITNKTTLKTEDYIIKSWGDDYPELGLNEYYCMRCVAHAKIPTPSFYLSNDDRLFIMKRFDILDNGKYLGFEDMCVLQGKSRDDKYQGSYEKITKTLKLFVSARHRWQSLYDFYKLTILNYILGNGDAHLKNFGVIYSDHHDIQLAPAYDVISTTAYIAQDIPALTLYGSKRWWGKSQLQLFGVEHCDLTHAQAQKGWDECMVALTETSIEINARLETEQHPEKMAVLLHLKDRMKAS